MGNNLFTGNYKQQLQILKKSKIPVVVFVDFEQVFAIFSRMFRLRFLRFYLLFQKQHYKTIITFLPPFPKTTLQEHN